MKRLPKMKKISIVDFNNILTPLKVSLSDDLFKNANLLIVLWYYDTQFYKFRTLSPEAVWAG